MDRNSDEFVKLLTSCQSPLYGCILALLPDRTAAQDILQETNLTLCHKAEDFEAGTSFMAWATRIARYHILNYRRKMQHERLIFDEELFRELCERQEAVAGDTHQYAGALKECLTKLSKDHYELVSERYAAGGSVSQIAAARGQSVGAVSQMLYRIRESLLNCISQRLQSGVST